MKIASRKVIIAMIGIVFAIMLVTGCEETNASKSKSDVKKHQLIAVENIQLKKQLEQSDREIEKQKKLLDKCEQEKKVLEKQVNEDIEVIMGDFLKIFEEENRKLLEENEKLKTQIEELSRAGDG